MGLMAGVCRPSTLRVLIWPEQGEAGRGPGEVRPCTRNRRHALYEGAPASPRLCDGAGASIGISACRVVGPQVCCVERVDRSLRDSIGCIASVRGREDRLILRLAICVLFVGIGWAHAQPLDEGRPVRLAQQTTTVPPPPPPLPSTLPQAQALSSCLMSCDTRSGMCQGTCSVGNSPSLTLAAPTAGTRPDPGALAQCYLSCSTQQISCKQACPH
jgi:hypothetical protein